MPRSTLPRWRRDRSFRISTWRRSAENASGRATAKRRVAGARRPWRAGWPLSKKRLRARPRRLELLLRGLEQLLLGSEARAANRLAQLDPLHVVDFAELGSELAAAVAH